METAPAISSLRSGKDLPNPCKDHHIHQGLIEGDEAPIIVEQNSDWKEEEEQTKADPNLDTYKPPMPYPQALNCPKAKSNETDDHLLDTFKKVTITISLINDIKHIPSYAKFLKGICTPHRNPRRIQLSETLSSIMMNSLPIKKRDPRAPMMASEIGGMSFTRVPIVDMKMTKELGQAQIILGQPFLSTTKAITDWGKGEVILKVGEHTVKVDINKLMKYPSRASEDLGTIDFTDDQDLDACIEEVMMIDEEARYEELPMDEPSLELKILPSILKYAFLDEEKAKPVIISSKLDIKQEEKLLEVLVRNEDTIGWTLTNLKGLDPSLCTHRIFLEDESRPVREAQRQLIPIVWEAMKEEIVKWLNAEIIYLISDSQWVSPVHVVLKKAGVTVMTNEKCEEIQTRLSTKWRVCIDYQKMNSATKKDHFPLPFIDQILDRLAGSSYFCFLDR